MEDQRWQVTLERHKFTPENIFLVKKGRLEEIVKTMEEKDDACPVKFKDWMKKKKSMLLKYNNYLFFEISSLGRVHIMSKGTTPIDQLKAASCELYKFLTINWHIVNPHEVEYFGASMKIEKYFTTAKCKVSIAQEESLSFMGINKDKLREKIKRDMTGYYTITRNENEEGIPGAVTVKMVNNHKKGFNVFHTASVVAFGFLDLEEINESFRQLNIAIYLCPQEAKEPKERKKRKKMDDQMTEVPEKDKKIALELEELLHMCS
jgi:hypothetical protein